MTEINRPLRVFLCHAAKDWQAAHDLFLQLKQAGWLDVWFVGAELDFDQNWEAEIRSAMDRADVIIALISRRSYKRESYFYPDPNFVFNILDTNPRDDLWLLPLILGRVGVPKEMFAIGLDFSHNNQRKLVEQQILADLKQYAEEHSFCTDGSMKDVSAESKLQWSPTRWKDLKEIVSDSTQERNIENVSFRKPARQRSRIASWLVVTLLFVLLIVFSGIGLYMNGSGNPNSVAAPIVGKALTILSSSTPEATQKPAIPPTIDPGKGDVQFSSVDGAPLIYIPEGDFMMGSDYETREQPMHFVTVKAFWMDKFEVTNQQYAKCVKDGICPLPASKKFYEDPAYANHPVVYVDWDQAKTYCAWAGRRLPTEAEWEKAARGTDKRRYPWGSGISCEKANYGNHCVGGPAPVGSYPAGVSPYGVFDMAGNVWEWVFDWYDETYYGSRIVFHNPLGPSFGEHRVLRGGSWISAQNYLRTTDRWRNIPTYTSDYIGFRCAKPASH